MAKLKLLNPQTRINSYDEVVLGFGLDEAITEANRCLHCVNHPCTNGCPIHNDIPNFISKIKENNFEEAYKIISLTSSMPSVCSRVCASENQCEKNCTLGIKGEAICIHGLERFVSDLHESKIEKEINNNHKIAIIGAGPSGLTCAKLLAKKGYVVTIFESFKEAGGILLYGIPEFRLPKEIVTKLINEITNLGIEIRTNTTVGKDIQLEDIQKEYEAIYISIGTGISKFMGIKNEDLSGVYGANDFLLKANIYKESFIEEIRGKKVAVIGGGNVAMDVSRSAIRLQALKTSIIYRRSMQEMPANKDELNQTLDEGVNIEYLTNPVEIIGNDKVTGIKCIKMKLGEPDESGRRRPIEIQGSEFIVDADIIVMALSSTCDQLINNNTSKLAINKYGCFEVDEDGKTNIEGIYAGGDDVLGPATVVQAVNSGNITANAIDKFIKSKN